RYHNMPTLTSLAEASAALERLQQRYAARDTIRWAIELVEAGEMIGTVGLLRFDFEHRRAEVGYEIARRWWGRGLATEAAAAVIRYGLSVLGHHRTSPSRTSRRSTACDGAGENPATRRRHRDHSRRQA